MPEILKTHLANVRRHMRHRRLRPTLQRLRSAVAAAPLDPSRHDELAQALARAGRTFAAHAALRSAAFLRREGDRAVERVHGHRVADDELLAMEHNQYFRLRTLADKVNELAASDAVTVLDAGGGDGMLAQFLPDVGYFLVEPSVNGIPGEALPFGDDAFDYVVSCHVLEHVPPAQRFPFLDSLMRRARRGLVLLNPFDDPRTSVAERLRLFVDATHADWAKEHLECSLPEVELVERYAAERDLHLTREPNGFMPLSAALVFASHFGQRLGRRSALRAINRYFNTRLVGLLDSAECPNAWLVTLTRR